MATNLLPVAARGPPENKNLPPLVWLGGALAFGLVMCLLGVAVGAGIGYMAWGPATKPGAAAAPKLEATAKAAVVIVGKWEATGEFVLRPPPIMEFKSDGTGTNEGGGPLKWHITDEEKPVLILEFSKTHRDQFHVKREGDTLTLSPFDDELRKPRVLRRLK